MSGSRGPERGRNAVKLKPLWPFRGGSVQARTCLLPYSDLPVSPFGDSSFRNDFRLPSLSTSTHFRTTTVPLSVSEPYLCIPGKGVCLQGFPTNHHIPLRKPHPSGSSKTPTIPKPRQQGCHQVYLHFSQPLRHISRRHAGNEPVLIHSPSMEHRSLQAVVKPYRPDGNLQALSVRGKSCLFSKPLLIPAGPGTRPQLHVFVPTIGKEDGGDSESLDEGFMDELDNKVHTLRLQDDEKHLQTSDTTTSDIPPLNTPSSQH